MYLVTGVTETVQDACERYKNVLKNVLNCDVATLIESEDIIYLKRGGTRIKLKLIYNFVGEHLELTPEEGITGEELDKVLKENWKRFLPPYQCASGIKLPTWVRDQDTQEYIYNLFDSIYEDVIIDDNRRINTAADDVAFFYERKGDVLVILPLEMKKATMLVYRELERMVR